MTRTPGQSEAGAHPATATVQPLVASPEPTLTPAAPAAAAEPERAIDPVSALDIGVHQAIEPNSSDMQEVNTPNRWALNPARRSTLNPA